MKSPFRGILIGLPISLAIWACGFYAARAGLDVPPAAPDTAAIAAQAAAQVQQSMPGAATSAPPGTATDSIIGTSPLFARADHTHATSVQRVRMTVSPAGQPVRWTFVKPYDAGVVPVVTCTAQNVSGATRPFVVNTVGDPTATYADLIVFQAAQPTVALLNISLTLFGTAPTGTIVNCQAAKPTQ